MRDITCGEIGVEKSHNASHVAREIKNSIKKRRMICEQPCSSWHVIELWKIEEQKNRTPHRNACNTFQLSQDVSETSESSRKHIDDVADDEKLMDELKEDKAAEELDDVVSNGSTISPKHDDEVPIVLISKKSIGEEFSVDVNSDSKKNSKAGVPVKSSLAQNPSAAIDPDIDTLSISSVPEHGVEDTDQLSPLPSRSPYNVSGNTNAASPRMGHLSLTNQCANEAKANTVYTNILSCC